MRGVGDEHVEGELVVSRERESRRVRVAIHVVGVRRVEAFGSAEIEAGNAAASDRQFSNEPALK